MEKNKLNEKGIVCLNNKFYKVVLEEINPILDPVEREYLRNVIKPFRNRIDYICKVSSFSDYCIVICLFDDDGIALPYFSKNSNMYKNMELDKEYSLEDLGL